MKPCLNAIFAIISILVFGSCGDSHEKLMKDQIDWMEEMTGVVNEVADGKLSSSEAADRIGELGKEGGRIFERKAALNKDLSPEKAQELLKSHGKESIAALQNYMKAVQRLSTSGRMTREVASALENIKTD